MANCLQERINRLLQGKKGRPQKEFFFSGPAAKATFFLELKKNLSALVLTTPPPLSG